MAKSSRSTATAASVRDTDVAVVIVNYRTPELTERCVAALAAERRSLPRLRVLVVDGGSADGSAEKLAKALSSADFADWVEFQPLAINGGYGWANNQAILSLSAEPNPPEFIHILNPDTEVQEGAVTQLLEALKSCTRRGAAGSQLIGPDGAAVPSAFRFPSFGREFVTAARSEAVGRLLRILPTVVDSANAADVDWVSGASVMFRAEALRDVGLFDDGFFLYFEEVELMHRLKTGGWSVRHAPQSRVVHIEGASTGGPAARAQPRTWYESRRRYFALTGGAMVLASANAARLAGRALSLVRSMVGKSQGGDGASVRDLLRSGFWPRSRDARRSPVSWRDSPGKPPAWMAER